MSVLKKRIIPQIVCGRGDFGNFFLGFQTTKKFVMSNEKGGGTKLFFNFCKEFPKNLLNCDGNLKAKIFQFGKTWGLNYKNPNFIQPSKVKNLFSPKNGGGNLT